MTALAKMRNIWLKIITNKSNPVFWPLLFVLWICSIFYQIALSLHKVFSSGKIKLQTPVVSVGNLTVGGSGKTPVTIELAEYFLSKNKKVGIVASGYGRKNKRSVLSPGSELSQMSINDTGDEVKMMAEKLPDVYFAVDRTKNEAAFQLQKKFKSDIIIVDDGYQHRKLFRNLNLLLIDAFTDLRKESLFPLGRRREPLRAVSRADAVIITKTNMFPIDSDFRQWISTIFKSKPVAEIEFVNEYPVCGDERRKIENITEKIYFFAALGSFDILLNHLKKQIPNIIGFRQFHDHCRYEHHDITKIKNDIDRLKPDYIITTQKDFVKIKKIDFGLEIYTLDLRLQFVSGEKSLFEMLDKVVED